MSIHLSQTDPFGYVPEEPLAEEDYWTRIIQYVNGLTPRACRGICSSWIENEREKGKEWLEELKGLDCPCTENEAKAKPDVWTRDKAPPGAYHPGCDICYRAPSPTVNILGQGPGQQCCYSKGDLINAGPGRGTPDRYYPGIIVDGRTGLGLHMKEDVLSYMICLKAGMVEDYFDVRPSNPGKEKDGSPCAGAAHISGGAPEIAK